MHESSKRRVGRQGPPLVAGALAMGAMPMSRVSVLIPQALRPLAGGASVREVSAATVEEALNAIEQVAPGFLARILTPEGELRPLVNIFVGDTSVRARDGLATPVEDGEVIAVIPAVAGG